MSISPCADEAPKLKPIDTLILAWYFMLFIDFFPSTVGLYCTAIACINTQ
jgi:hypothetical protein